MRFEAWRFSAKLAWQDRFVKWMTLGTLFFTVIVVGFSVWKMVPTVFRSGILTYHYNIYLGVDDVRVWQWFFVPIGIIFLVQIVNAGVGYGVYRQDKLATRSLLGLSAAITLLWATSLFFLVIINL